MSKSVHDMFASISKSYDRANDVLSLGIHRLWRRSSLKIAGIHAKHPARALDLCCGTGDFCTALKNRLHPNSHIIGLDFVFPMLTIAKSKTQDQHSAKIVNKPNTISLVHGDAMALPFPEKSFDVCTIGFGIRNVDDPKVCLENMRSVLRSGGKAIVLEFGPPESKLIGPFFNWYSKHIMPRLGAFVSGNKSAYEYLPETSARFPCQKDFCRLMEEAGFKNVFYKPFLGGIAYVYVGES